VDCFLDSEGGLLLSFDLASESGMVVIPTYCKINDAVKLGAW
jgi:hypothetical protein